MKNNINKSDKTLILMPIFLLILAMVFYIIILNRKANCNDCEAGDYINNPHSEVIQCNNEDISFIDYDF